MPATSRTDLHLVPQSTRHNNSWNLSKPAVKRTFLIFKEEAKKAVKVVGKVSVLRYFQYLDTKQTLYNPMQNDLLKNYRDGKLIKIDQFDVNNVTISDCLYFEQLLNE